MKVIKPNNLSQLDGSFKRASTATYIDGGVLKYAAVDEPRFQDGVLLLEKRATNLQLYSQDLSSGAYANCNRGPSAAFYAGSVPFWYVSKLFNSPYEYCESGRVSVSDGEQIEASCAFLAGNSTVCEVALYGHGGSGRGETTDATLEVLSGPGYFIAQHGSGAGLVNLSATIPTLIRVRRVQRGADSGVSFIFYPGGSGSLVIGESIQATRFQLLLNQSSESYIPTTTTAVTREPDCIAGNFTRASVGTYIDNGLLKTAATNEPRFQNGVLLLEKAATNRAAGSSNFVSYWATDGLSTLTPAAAAGPDGLMTATRWTRGANQYLYRQPLAEGIPAGCGAVSIFVKPDGWDSLRVSLMGPIPTVLSSSDFNLSSGVVTPVIGSSGVAQALANGWWRLSILTPDGTTPRLVELVMLSAPAATGFLLDRFQVEADAVTSHIPTTTAPVTRAADTELPSIAYSNATDSTPLWSSGTTYSAGQKVRYQSKIYESLVGSNLNNIPSTTPLSWLDLGADNIHAMIDGIVNTPTKRTENLRVILRPGQFDSLALIDMNATISTASVYDSNTYELIYSNKAGLSGVEVFDWYQYFFYSPTTERSQYVLTGIPTNPNVIVALDLTVASTEEVSVGQLTIGLSEDLGGTQYGAKAGIVDYSKKSTDEFGTITFVERPYSKKLEAEIYFANSQMNRIHKYLTSIRATPVVWIASDDPTFEEAMVIYGFYKDFSTTIAYPSHSLCNLQIEGLT